MKYNVFYDEVHIGVLEINEIGQHKYTPTDEMETVRKCISIFHDLLVKSDWREPIPFFQNRIMDAKRFSQENYIVNQTDPFVMIKQD